MTIDVVCPACRSQHRVGIQLAGTKAQCRCGHVLTVPQLPAPRPAARAPVAPSPTANRVLRVQCPACRRIHQVGPQLAGTAARCGCGQILQIGASIGAPSAPSPARGSLLDELTTTDWERARQPAASATPAHRIRDDEILRRHLQPEGQSPRKTGRSTDRPGGLVALAVLNFLGAAGLFLLLGLVAFVSEKLDLAKHFGEAPLAGILFTLGFFAALAIAVGVGFLQRHPWGFWLGGSAYVGALTLSLFAIVVDILGVAGGQGADQAAELVKDAIRAFIEFGVVMFLLSESVRGYYRVTTPAPLAGLIMLGGGLVTALVMGVIVTASAISIGGPALEEDPPAEEAVSSRSDSPLSPSHLPRARRWA